MPLRRAIYWYWYIVDIAQYLHIAIEPDCRPLLSWLYFVVVCLPAAFLSSERYALLPIFHFRLASLMLRYFLHIFHYSSSIYLIITDIFFHFHILFRYFLHTNAFSALLSDVTPVAHTDIFFFFFFFTIIMLHIFRFDIYFVSCIDASLIFTTFSHFVFAYFVTMMQRFWFLLPLIFCRLFISSSRCHFAIVWCRFIFADAAASFTFLLICWRVRQLAIQRFLTHIRHMPLRIFYDTVWLVIQPTSISARWRQAASAAYAPQRQSVRSVNKYKMR